MDRMAFLTKHLDLQGLSMLEMGALDKPVLPPDAFDVCYLDHLSTAELRRKYESDPSVDASKIVDVRYVWHGGSIADSVVDRQKFDLVLASHVFEHFPNPVGWLLDVPNILKDDGCICLMLPDKRFTFDLDRRNTILSDWIGWYLEKLERPSPRQVFDHFSNVRDVSSAEVWDDPSYCGAGNIHQMSEALDFAVGSVGEQRYVD